MASVSVRGLGASPGKARGALVLSVEKARLLAPLEPVVLVLRDCRSEDARVLAQAAALVTVHGGVTGHGAIIARAMGKPCIVACRALDPRPAEGELVVRPEGGEALTLREGDVLEIDGGKGLVIVDVPVE